MKGHPRVITAVSLVGIPLFPLFQLRQELEEKTSRLKDAEEERDRLRQEASRAIDQV